jgi:long-subunit acyl-CoA synthetase (AMP-forming)
MALIRFARGFLALGIAKDEKVALWFPNRPRWFYGQYGAAKLGIVK